MSRSPWRKCAAGRSVRRAEDGALFLVVNKLLYGHARWINLFNKCSYLLPPPVYLDVSYEFKGQR